MPKVQHGRIHGTSLFLVRFHPYSVILNVQWLRLFYELEYVNGLFSFILGIPRGSFPCRHAACSMQKAKPNANTRTLRPDKCLVVKSLDSSLRPAALRNMESTAITTRELKATREDRF